MRKILAAAVAVTLLCALTATAQEVQLGPTAAPSLNSNSSWVFGTECVWDNGDTDGINGISHLQNPRRTVLEDFEVGPDGQCFTGLNTLFIWNTLPPGSGDDMNIWFRDDVGQAPGPVNITANVTGYDEEATGRSWFGRLEGKIHATFDEVCFDEGIYWVEMQVLGPENGFQMVQVNNPRLEPVWVDYAGLTNGPEPGRVVFGVDYHVSFCLTASGGGGGCDDNCDVDCSGTVDAFDIEPFLELLFGDPPVCCEGAGDADGNGVVDAFDIGPFLDCLFP